MADAVFEVSLEISDPVFFEALADPRGLTEHLTGAMQEIVTEFKDRAEEYAPESEANRPGRVKQDGTPMGYYERGRGWWYPLVTHNTLGLGGEIPLLRPHLKSPKTLKAGALMAQGFSGVAGYRLVPNSEQMHDRWMMKVMRVSDTDVIGVVSNSASYSNLVQGTEQNPLHRERGWQTVVDVWETGEMQEIVSRVTDRAIADFYNLAQAGA